MFKAFRRSLTNRGSTSSYHSWTDEPEDEEPGSDQPFADGPPSPLKVDCFYLGSQDMTGQPIQGKGCLRPPIENVWSLTQEGKVRRRSTKQPPHNSGSTSRPKSPPNPDCEEGVPNLSKIKFVQIQAGPDTISVSDCNSNEMIIEFSINRVATCGRHLGLPQSFAFVAREGSGSTPFCHVFKCDDDETSKTLAEAMDKVFGYHLQRRKASASARSEKVSSTSSTGTTQHA